MLMTTNYFNSEGDPPLSEGLAYWILDSGVYTAETTELLVIVTPSSQVIAITDKRNSRTYNTEATNFTLISTTNSRGHLQLKTASYTIDLAVSSNDIRVSIIGSPTAATSELRYPGRIASNADDFLVVPRSGGYLHPVTEAYPSGMSSTYRFNSWKSTMGFVGVTNFTSGYMIMAEEPYDIRTDINTYGTSYLCPKITIEATKNVLGYNRHLHLVFVNDGYIGMAEWYRAKMDSLGYGKTFAQKSNTNPNITRLNGAVVFWYSKMGLSTTSLARLMAMGLDRAIWESWYSMESTLFAYINSNNMLSSNYELYTDVYAANYSPGYTETAGYPDDVIRKSDQTLQVGYGITVNGVFYPAYYRCSDTLPTYIKASLDVKIPTYGMNCAYIDVTSSDLLRECYSAMHSQGKREDAISRREGFKYVKDHYPLVTGGEEGKDLYYDNLDYGGGEMGLFRGVTPPGVSVNWYTVITDNAAQYAISMNAAKRVPLVSLCYRDCHLPTWHPGDGMTKVNGYWDTKELMNIICGSMPLFFPASAEHWTANEERFMETYHLVCNLNREIGLVKMISHYFVPDTDRLVQHSNFEGGWGVRANFGTASHTHEGHILPQYGFYATDGEFEAFRQAIGGTTVSASYITNRLYLNGHGVEHEYKGVKVTYSVFLRKDASSIHIAFIGADTVIKLKSADMPWPFTKAFDESNNTELALTDLGSGWYSVAKPSGQFIYLTNE